MIPAGPLIAAYFSVAAVSLSLGYYTGTSKPSQSTHTATATKPEKSESESGEGYFLDDCKLVLAVRTDLGMTTGKIAAQHAVLTCYKTLRAKDPALLRRWKGAIFVLRCADEDQLLTLQAQAQSLNLCARSIQDAGRTQIAAGSTTVLGVMGTWTECSFLTETLAVYL